MSRLPSIGTWVNVLNFNIGQHSSEINHLRVATGLHSLPLGLKLQNFKIRSITTILMMSSQDQSQNKLKGKISLGHWREKDMLITINLTEKIKEYLICQQQCNRIYKMKQMKKMSRIKLKNSLVLKWICSTLLWIQWRVESNLERERVVKEVAAEWLSCRSYNSKLKSSKKLNQ